MSFTCAKICILSAQMLSLDIESTTFSMLVECKSTQSTQTDISDAYLRFYTQYRPPELTRISQDLDEGQELDVSDFFRDPSNPWRIGDLPNTCAPNQRCQSPQPVSYRLLSPLPGATDPILITGNPSTPKGVALLPNDVQQDVLYDLTWAIPMAVPNAGALCLAQLDSAHSGASEKIRQALTDKLRRALTDDKKDQL
jgi:hypothetical protein